MHQTLASQYDCDCEDCNRINLENGAKKLDFNAVLKAAEKAFKTLFSLGKYKPEHLNKIPEYKSLINATAQSIGTAIAQEVPPELKGYLEKDVFIFSGLKTHTQLTEARSLLKDEKGNPRSYASFEQEILKTNPKYNQLYLEAEYLFAVQSSQSAANWANLQDDTSRYWLEYRTAGDDRVRESHERLRGITLPKDDAFWSEYYPPNGWRCFLPETLILTENGWVQIRDIKQRDWLVGGSGDLKFVEATHINTFNGNLITLFAKGKKISCTPNHRFFTSKGWVQSELIEIGDIIIQVGKIGFFNKFINAIYNTKTLFLYALMSVKRKRKPI